MNFKDQQNHIFELFPNHQTDQNQMNDEPSYESISMKQESDGENILDEKCRETISNIGIQYLNSEYNCNCNSLTPKIQPSLFQGQEASTSVVQKKPMFKIEKMAPRISFVQEEIIDNVINNLENGNNFFISKKSKKIQKFNKQHTVNDRFIKKLITTGKADELNDSRFNDLTPQQKQEVFKKIKNRFSAQSSREKKKLEQEKIRKEQEKTNNENKKLKKDVFLLEKEIQKLKEQQEDYLNSGMVFRHEFICRHCGAHNYINCQISECPVYKLRQKRHNNDLLSFGFSAIAVLAIFMVLQMAGPSTLTSTTNQYERQEKGIKMSIKDLNVNLNQKFDEDFFKGKDEIQIEEEQRNPYQDEKFYLMDPSTFEKHDSSEEIELEEVQIVPSQFEEKEVKSNKWTNEVKSDDWDQFLLATQSQKSLNTTAIEDDEIQMEQVKVFSTLCPFEDMPSPPNT